MSPSPSWPTAMARSVILPPSCVAGMPMRSIGQMTCFPILPLVSLRSCFIRGKEREGTNGSSTRTESLEDLASGGPLLKLRDGELPLLDDELIGQAGDDAAMRGVRASEREEGVAGHTGEDEAVEGRGDEARACKRACSDKHRRWFKRRVGRRTVLFILQGDEDVHLTALLKHAKTTSQRRGTSLARQVMY